MPTEWCKCLSCWGWFVEEHPGEDLDELGRDLSWWSGLPVHRDPPEGVVMPEPDKTPDLTFTPVRQVWVLQYRTRGASGHSWVDLTEIACHPLEELGEAENRTPHLDWRLIRRTDEEVVVPDGKQD